MPLRVGVLGARGKTGREVCRAPSEAPDLELVTSVNSDDDLADLLNAEAHTVVDFTSPTRTS